MKCFIGIFAVVMALELSAIDVKLPVTVKDWIFRVKQKSGAFCEGNGIKINIPNETVMFQINSPMKLRCDFETIAVKAKFCGKGTFQIGIHMRTEEGVYFCTRPGKKYTVDTEGKFIDFESLISYGKFADAATKKNEIPNRGYYCIYAYLGTKGIFTDFRYSITPSKPDMTSPVSPFPAPKNEYALQRQLLLPPEIYAVQGVECNIYFDNILLVPNPESYIFDMDGRGINLKDRWTFIPEKKDIGRHKMSMKVIGPDGHIAALKNFYLNVAPANAGQGKNYSLLMVGDSITDYVTAYPTQVFTRFQGPANPKLTMIGTRFPKNAKSPLIKHEGYSGWAWNTFLNRGPFVRKSGSKTVLDIPGYLAKNNGGKAPDFITFQLGVNDIFAADDFFIYTALDDIEKQMDTLVQAFRKAAPNAIIGIGLATPGATQDGFGKVYRCWQTRWQYKRNIFALADRVIRKYHKSGDKKIFIVPMELNLDCKNNFPTAVFPVNDGNSVKTTRQIDGVHPSPAGGRQLGDTMYAFLKYQMYLIK